nr:MAG TPA: hypothetical protein [Bacteriophage sp.]
MANSESELYIALTPNLIYTLYRYPAVQGSINSVLLIEIKY